MKFSHSYIVAPLIALLELSSAGASFGFDSLPDDLVNVIYSFSKGKEVKVKLDREQYLNFYTGKGFINKNHQQAVEYMIDDYFKFIDIQGGSFNMGSPRDEIDRDNDEGLIQDINISDFSVQTTQVTQFQYWLVTKSNPSRFKKKANCPKDHVTFNGLGMCPNHPVEMVSWDDAQTFIKSLNEKSDDYTYSLPTEAQWEYAARAGTTTRYSFGDNAGDLGKYAWYNANSDNQTHQVASLEPNPFGLSDMHGNVWELVEDNWSGSSSRFAKKDDPVFKDSSRVRVVRGGCWNLYPRILRSAIRDNGWSFSRLNNLGLRLVRAPK